VSVETVPGTTCPGTGRRWATGDAKPMCPVCHVRYGGLGVPKPQRVPRAGWAGLVPDHERRAG
jgi:hypothetical protein